MKLNRYQIRRLIKEQLSLVLENDGSDDYLDRMAKSPASAGTPGISSLKTVRDMSRGEASMPTRPPLSKEGKIFLSGIIVIGITGLAGIAHLENRDRTSFVVEELSKMTASEIEQELNERLPVSFKSVLNEQGTSMSELAIQIEQMSPDQIRDILKLQIQLDSGSYGLGEPLIFQGGFNEPDFKYDD